MRNRSRKVSNRPSPTVREVPSGWIAVATDGSCLKNPGGASGWAWFVDRDNWAAGGFPVGTNQQAEILAVIHALETIPLHLPLWIQADSQYAIKSATVWLPGWKKRGWKKADGKPVMNLELMQRLDAALDARSGPVKFQWVPGHAGVPANEIADALCGAAAHATRNRDAVQEGPGWAAR